MLISFKGFELNKILLVEDSTEQQKIICEVLNQYNVIVVDNAEEAAVMVKNQNFELIIIDINLPGKNGYYLLGEIQVNSDLDKTPILCLSARSEINDKISAFSLGADDYVTKPFDLMELRARVDSKIAKKNRIKSKALTTVIGDVEIDHLKHKVMIGRVASQRKEVLVTQTEFKLLWCLARRPEQIFSREQLLFVAWGETSKVLDRVVDVHICQLRKKIGNCGVYIKTVSGVGYKLIIQDSREYVTAEV